VGLNRTVQVNSAQPGTALTYIQQTSSNPPVGDGGDQYTGWDRFSRVIDQRWIATGTVTDLERVQYGFDQAGNRVWRDNPVADAASANQDEFYTYDGLYQLAALQRGTLNSGRTEIIGTPTWVEDFTFDPTGNWDNYQTKVSGSTTLNQNRTHNEANEISTIAGSSAYMATNAAGNITKAPQPGRWSAAYNLTYDAWNRMVKVMSGSTTVATYAYDGQNRRTTKTTGSTVRHYYYTQQWQIVEERVGSSTSVDRQLVWGLGEVIVKVVNPTDAVRAEINLAGVKQVSPAAKAIVLAGAQTDENSLDGPKHIVPVEKPFTLTGPQFGYDFPQYSMTVLRIKAQ
jgi:hypothetical protein